MSVVGPELPELAPAVRVLKALTVEGAGQAVLKTVDETPLLVVGVPGAVGGKEGEQARGMVTMVTVAFGFEWTDLQAKPLMVPLMWELVKQGVGAARGSWSALAGEVVRVPGRSAELRGEGGGTMKVAADVSQQPIRNAGVWRAVDDVGALRGLVAVNADPAGGRTDAQPSAAVGTWLGVVSGGEAVKWIDGKEGLGGGGVGAALARTSDSTRFVLPLILGAIGLALLELMMARWFSHAVKPGSAGIATGGATA